MGHCISICGYDNEEKQIKRRRETIAKMDNNNIELDLESLDEETLEDFLDAYEIVIDKHNKRIETLGEALEDVLEEILEEKKEDIKEINILPQIKEKKVIYINV